MLVVKLFLLFVTSTLVSFGAYFGFKHDAINFPILVNPIHRDISFNMWFVSFVIGFLLFCAVFYELYITLKWNSARKEDVNMRTAAFAQLRFSSADIVKDDAAAENEGANEINTVSIPETYLKYFTISNTSSYKYLRFASMFIIL